MIAFTGSSIARRISSALIVMFFGKTADQVAALDLGDELLGHREHRRDRELDGLRRPLAQQQRVLLLHVLDDRFVQLVAADADARRRHDAAERDDRDLGGAATDVDDHVAGRLVDRAARRRSRPPSAPR